MFSEASAVFPKRKIGALVACSVSLDEKWPLQGSLGCEEEGTKGHMLWTYAALQAALFKMCDLGAQPWLLGRAQVFHGAHCLHGVLLQYILARAPQAQIWAFPHRGPFWFLKSRADELRMQSGCPPCRFVHLGSWFVASV